MEQLNYHHLRYFREVARGGTLTQAAERLNLSQSALSSQIKVLEARLGHDLFNRVGRRLELTEAGRIALDHSDRIFGTGAELLATLARNGPEGAPLRIGALSTLSRNFQMRFLGPVLEAGAPIVLRSGDGPSLLTALRALSLDVVLMTEAPGRELGDGFTAHRLAEQPVGIYGAPERLDHPDLRSLLAAEQFILPSEPQVRRGFDALAARLEVTPRIVAEVDDMAMVRLLAREDAGLAIAPAVVLADEIASGRIAPAPFDLRLTESFFAVTIPRSFPHPMLAELIGEA